MLIIFADSAFAISESQAIPGQRYLKQIKQRSGGLVYGAANVCLCSIVKPYNFLQFGFEGCGAESDHLMHYTEQHRKDTETRVIQLHSRGLTLHEIAAETHISFSTVDRLLKRLGKTESAEG
jgi:hypothetical protein